MYGDLNTLIEKIAEKSETDQNKVKENIEEKEREFSGLISKEGAAHIVAKEMGINLLEKKEGLKVENIQAGMKGLNLTAKILGTYGPKEFQKEDRKGKVGNVFLGDETGTTRLSLWNEQTSWLDKLQKGDVINLKNCFTVEDNMGKAEIRLGKFGSLEKSDKDIEVKSTGPSYKPVNIKDITAGNFVEIRGALVQIFDSKMFYQNCPECGKKDCEHEKKTGMIISGIVDDGTENIRVVFFNNNAELLLGMKTREAYEESEKGENTNKLINKLNTKLGKEFLLKGKVKENDFFGKPELIVNDIQKIKPAQAVEKVLKGE